MNSKSTWVWSGLAVALFAFIFFFERHFKQPDTGPQKILAGFHAADITAVSVRPGDQAEIRVVRTNESWHLTQPLDYPAENDRLAALLDALEKLTPQVPPIAADELRKHTNADEEFGFTTPQFSLGLYRGGSLQQIQIGSRTAPGDQVFLRVVEVEDVFVVDANLLTVIPRTPNDWRERVFADVSRLNFNRITMSSGGKICELQRDGTNQPWRITRMTPARADNPKIEELLNKLSAVQVKQFISDTAQPDLENYGLQAPDMELSFSDGAHSVLELQIGKSPTNDAAQVFARRDGHSAIVTLPKDVFDGWHPPFENFRDRHLVAITPRLSTIEVHASDTFTLHHQTNDTWTVQPQNYLADSSLMVAFLTNLAALKVTEFVKDVVTEPWLVEHGLAVSTNKMIFRTSNGGTNVTTVQLDFGSVTNDSIYTRRTDEDSVYAIALADFRRLPSNSWSLRDRHIWNFNVADVASITIQQHGRTKKLLRNAEYHWSIAAGSQGVVDDLSTEEIAKMFGPLTAAYWVDHEPADPTKYGFTENGHRLTFELKDGRLFTVEFGGEAPSQFPYAKVKLNGETWVFEFPWHIYQYVLMRFTIPANLP